LLIGLFTVVAGSAALAQMSDAEFTKFIQARADKFGEAFNKHDSATIAALYSEDAVRVAPTGIQHGRAEITKSLENGFKNNNPRGFVAVVEQAHQDGDGGWAVGSFSLTIFRAR
jgi:ketosteroid isomerase-like protein